MAQIPKDSESGTGGVSASRRQFIQLAAASTALAIAWSEVQAQTVGSASSAVKVANLEDLQVGQPVNFSYPDGYPAAVIKLGSRADGGVGSEGDVVAFSIICTHMGCGLGFQEANHSLECPCHQSRFSALQGGFVLQGPAPRALPQVSLELRGSEVWATGIVAPPFGAAIKVEEVGKIYGIPEAPVGP